MQVERRVFVVERRVAVKTRRFRTLHRTDRRFRAWHRAEGQRGVAHGVGADGRDGGGGAVAGGHGDERDFVGARPVEAAVRENAAGVRVFAAKKKAHLHGVVGGAIAWLENEILGA